MTILSNQYLLGLILILGLVLLVKGADWLVDGASAIAKRFGISDLIIGLTVVAFGTSMPEFVVNMVSIDNQATDLAITNILGSNIINTLVILGVTALIYPISSQKHSRKFDIPMSFIAAFLVLMMVVIDLPSLENSKGITTYGGIILFSFFCIFILITFRHAYKYPGAAPSINTKTLTLTRAIMLIIFGLIGLIIGGEMIVKSAVHIATNLGVSQSIIGLTIIALGTSLPELATSAMAAYKKNSDIALGNVIGSNIFNVFLILGVSAMIHPLPAYDNIEIDALIAALGSLLVWIFVSSNKEREIKRFEGGILLIIYIAYLSYRTITL